MVEKSNCNICKSRFTFDSCKPCLTGFINTLIDEVRGLKSRHHSHDFGGKYIHAKDLIDTKKMDMSDLKGEPTTKLPTIYQGWVCDVYFGSFCKCNELNCVKSQRDEFNCRPIKLQEVK